MPIRQQLTVTASIAVTIFLSGCGGRPATSLALGPSIGLASAPPGSSTPTARDPWSEANVVQPSAVTSAPSLLPGYQCHPCHFLAENQFFGVGEWTGGASAGGLIAVGVQQPPAAAIAFGSSDGREWKPIPGFTGTSGSTAIATASNGGRTVVVGLGPIGAAAWLSNGGSWTKAPSQPDLLVKYAAGAMTSVAGFGAGFVAGGYRDDPLHATASAAVWRSGDGLTWHADDASGTFGGGRIWGVAAAGGTLVAVGTGGDPVYGPAAAWRWTQGDGWQRARIGPDAGGAMRAVTATPSGFVAVGLNSHDDGARAWTSPDGLVWTAGPPQAAFDYFSFPLRMQSVVASPSGLVAGGWRSDAGKGSAVTWTSSDGVTWQGPVWENSFSGAQITGLALSGGTVVAVGRIGYPDWNQAAAWLSSTP